MQVGTTSSSFSLPLLPHNKTHNYTSILFTFKGREGKPRAWFPPIAFSASSTTKHVWRRTPQLKTTSSSSPSNQLTQKRHPRNQQGPSHLDHSIDTDELLSSIGLTQNEQELYSLMSTYKGRQLSIRFMVSLLSREPDWQRSLAILDWINEEALYTPSVFAYKMMTLSKSWVPP